MYDTVGICLTCEGVFLGLTKSPSTFPGMHTFISEDLAETMTALSESLLRKHLATISFVNGHSRTLTNNLRMYVCVMCV